MSWVEGSGAKLPKGALAWVDHKVHGVVWAEKDYYTETDEHGVDTIRLTWCAYGIGDSFHLEEVTRYWLIEKPELP